MALSKASSSKRRLIVASFTAFVSVAFPPVAFVAFFVSFVAAVVMVFAVCFVAVTIESH